jgi:hypothetical protein
MLVQSRKRKEKKRKEKKRKENLGLEQGKTVGGNK